MVYGRSKPVPPATPFEEFMATTSEKMIAARLDLVEFLRVESLKEALKDVNFATHLQWAAVAGLMLLTFYHVYTQYMAAKGKKTSASSEELVSSSGMRPLPSQPSVAFPALAASAAGAAALAAARSAAEPRAWR